MAVWDAFLTEEDRAVFARSGHGARAGFGKRPALLVVDVSYAFCGDKDEPIVKSVERWRNSCGAYAWQALPIIARVIAAARGKNVPVIYTTGGVRAQRDWGSWGWKNSRAVESTQQGGLDGYEIMPQIAPEPQDIVIRKLKPSAFFGTPLVSYLNQMQIDTLLIAGTTTSGCVRASVLDGFSLNYRMAVIEDCSFDRYQSSHAMNLFDIQAKYADVVGSGDAIGYFGRLPGDLFGAPEPDVAATAPAPRLTAAE
jgi:maleamate amidohydrolase